MTTQFKDTTYSLAKALHHINIANEYFDDLRRSSNGNVKNLFNSYIVKCNWILLSIVNRLGDESRTALKNEMDDSFNIEAINDKLIKLTSDQRIELELIIDKMLQK